MLYSFEDFVLDSDRRELRCRTGLIGLEPQVFDLLEYLIRNRERVATKDDLLAAVWGGRIVSESVLTTRINAARSAIGDSGKDQRFIRTLPRKGVRFVGEVREARRTSPPPEAPAPALALPDRPSIAVLPFANMSGEAEQEYFADGVVEDIITALSRMSWLFVIARNSSFVYKGRAVDVKRVGQELGVRYVLEGSVRKAANRVRITGQLIDAATGGHLWADRFDGNLDDVFDLQDLVTAASWVRSRRGWRRPRSSAPSASAPTASTPTITICAASGTSISARARPTTKRCGCSTARSRATPPSRQHTRWRRGAIRCGRRTAGWRTATPRSRRPPASPAPRSSSDATTPSSCRAPGTRWSTSCTTSRAANGSSGAPLRSIRTSPPPGTPAAGSTCSSASRRRRSGTWPISSVSARSIRRCRGCRARLLSPTSSPAAARQAVAHAEAALSENPVLHMGLRAAALSCALAGHTRSAHGFMARLREIDPALRISNLQDVTPLQRPQDVALYAEGLRKAGLPE